MRKIWILLAALLMLSCVSAFAGMYGVSAFADVPGGLDIKLSGANSAQLALDGNVETSCEFEELVITCETPAGALLLEWDEPPKSFFIGKQKCFAPLIREFIMLSTPSRRVELTAKNGRLAEIRAYAGRETPEGVQDWHSPAEKADILVIAAHPDDDMLYFGGVIPYYAGERGLSVQVVYMTAGERVRKSEALDALWLCGCKNMPVFIDYKDRFCTSTTSAARLWGGEQSVTDEIAALIRRFQPEVVVTHDLQGEYGHGAHMLTAKCALNAVKVSSTVKKLYLHLYPKNRIVMDWRKPLDAFDGKTALELADEGWKKHTSEQSSLFSVTDDGALSCAAFGLAYSRVGADKAKNDMFENITTE